MADVKAFWLEPVSEVERELRRFVSSRREDRKCPSAWGYHDASAVIGRMTKALPIGLTSEDRYERSSISPVDYEGDARWPASCAQCGYAFQADDEWQANEHRLYEAKHGPYIAQRFTLRTAPIGAMWDAWWMGDWHRGADGIVLVVKTPGGDWMVDSEASNCTRKGEKHECWVRHGDPRTGDVHVDKSGDTCAAGAGSIMIGSYHGFLHNGQLTSC